MVRELVAEVNVSKGQQDGFLKKTPEEMGELYDSLVSRHPDKIPIVFIQHKRSKLSCNKCFTFVSAPNVMFGYFSKVIKETVGLSSESTIYFSSPNSSIIRPSTLISEVLEPTLGLSPNFLYVFFCEIEPFG